MGIVNIILFDDDELTKAMVESYLKEVSFTFEFIHYNLFSENLIPNDNSSKIIFVNANNTNINILNSILKFSGNKKNNFIIISTDNSTDFHVKALRTGAKDFLLKPLIKADFISLINKIYNNEITKKVGDSMSDIYTVVSPENGTGKTFFLVNIAKEIADIKKEKVLIVDFNNNVNDISIMLDINSKYNTAFVLNSFTKENARSLLSNIQRYKDSSLYIMANGLYSNTLSVDKTKFELFLEEAKKMYKYIFLDLNPQSTGLNRIITNNVDTIFCLLNTRKELAEKAQKNFIALNVYGKVKFIINKYRERDKDKVNDIETILEKQVYAKIPQAAMSASMSMQNGKTLKELNPDMDIVKSYMELARRIVG